LNPTIVEAFLLSLSSFIFIFTAILGGTNKAVWAHAHNKHPSEVERCAMKPLNQRETVLDDGSKVKCYAYDDSLQFEQNTLLVKLLQKKGLSLSMSEDEDLRRWSTSMDQRTQPACFFFSFCLFSFCSSRSSLLLLLQLVSRNTRFALFS